MKQLPSVGDAVVIDLGYGCHEQLYMVIVLDVIRGYNVFKEPRTTLKVRTPFGDLEVVSWQEIEH